MEVMLLIVRPLFRWQKEANYWTNESHSINCSNRRSFIESLQRSGTFFSSFLSFLPQNFEKHLNEVQSSELMWV